MSDRINFEGTLKNLGGIIDKYIYEVLPEKSSSTQSSYLISSKRIRLVFGLMLPQKIIPKDVYQYHSIISNKNGKTAAKHDVQFLSTLLSQCVQWGIIGSNHLLGNVKIKNQPPRDRLVEDWEIDECLNLVPKIKSRSVVLIKLYIEFKVMSGWSRIDILKLKLSELKNDGIHSQRQKTKNSTAKRIILEWDNELHSLVEKIKKLPPKRINNDYLFITREGKPFFNPTTMKCNAFDSIWKRFMDRVIELTKVTDRFHEHDLRAYVASNSSSLEEASERLSHASTSTTKRVYRRKPVKVKPLHRK